MSKGPKSVVTGYRYYLTFHLGFCLSVVDRVREIWFDKRVAWRAGIGSSGGDVPEDPSRIGSYTALATAGTPEEGVAVVNIEGKVVSVTAGRDVEITLADASTVEVTVVSAGYDADNDVTTWTVTPRTTAFASQTVALVVPSFATPSSGIAVDISGAEGTIYINEPNLFGGTGTREGGVEGYVDLLFGRPDQVQNPELVAIRGATEVPAYRGLLSMVFRDFYVGNTHYLKDPAAVVTHIRKDETGNEIWYVEKSEILVDGDVGGEITLNSISNAAITHVEGLARGVTMTGFDPSDVVPIRLASGAWSPWGLPNLVPGQPSGSVNEIHVLIDGDTDNPVVFGTKDRYDGYEEATANFPSDATITGGSEYTFYILDTPIEDNTGALNLVVGDISDPDMNPAHIIRECLVNAVWGLAIPESEIDDESFRAAADQLHAEGLGLSFPTQVETEVEEFIGEIKNYIDAEVFTSNRTGKWKLSLIRDDYDVGLLPVFDTSRVVDWGEVARREVPDLINRVVIKYTDKATYEPAAAVAFDPARVQIMGAVRSRELSYRGIRHHSLADRIAHRELRGLSALMVSGQLVLNREGAVLEPGDPFVLFNDRLALNDVMRAVEVGEGDGRSNGIPVKYVSDEFALGEAALSAPPVPFGQGLASEPAALERRMVLEAPYWLLVRDEGHAGADAILDAEPDAGRLAASAERLSPDAFGAEIWTSDSEEFVQDGLLDYVPTALLAADLSDDPTDTTLAIGEWTELANVQPGALAALGDELVRIDAVTDTSATVGRGALDTVPQAHVAGAPLIVFGQLPSGGATDYVNGDELSVKLLTTTPLGTLPLSVAPEDVVTFDSRAIRPLPPGNVRADGTFTPDEGALQFGDVELTWAHRDRQAQTSLLIDDYLAGNIGPEPGVSYEVEIRWEDPVSGEPIEPPAAQIDAATGTSYTLRQVDVPTGSAPAGNVYIRVRVRAKRTAGGEDYREWQNREFRFLTPNAGGWDLGWDFDWDGSTAA